MVDKKSLKPCPFCGGLADIYQDTYSFFVVQCKKCNNGTLHYRSPEEAQRHWNRRTAAEKFDCYHDMNGELVRCRDCKHYEVKDHWANFGGVPILAASDVPTCHKWSDGCMTKPDGYCFMGERRDDDAKQSIGCEDVR